jgi:hypothetical protein
MTAADRTTPPEPPPHRTGFRLAPAHRQVPAALGAFVVVLLSLQIFLLSVGLDALLADEDDIAWVTAACSVVLAAGSAAFYRYLR